MMICACFLLWVPLCAVGTMMPSEGWLPGNTAGIVGDTNPYSVPPRGQGTPQDHQEPSTATKDHQEPSTATKDHQEPSTATKDHQEPSTATKDHHEPSTATKDHQEPSTATNNHQETSTATEDHQEPSTATKESDSVGIATDSDSDTTPVSMSDSSDASSATYINSDTSSLATFLHSITSSAKWGYPDAASVSAAFHSDAPALSSSVTHTSSRSVTPFRHRLELIYNSPTSGYIQSPSWNRTDIYPLDMNDSVVLNAPPGHVIMVSVVSNDLDLRTTRRSVLCEGDVLTVSALGNAATSGTSDDDRARNDDNSHRLEGAKKDNNTDNGDISDRNDDGTKNESNTFSDMGVKGSDAKLSHATTSPPVWTVCKKMRPEPTLISSGALHVHFQSDDRERVGDKGFRLLFTFHNISASIPKKGRGSKWNCSVPHWADFAQHFPCNLHNDCLDGEDEKSCPYTTGRCGAGFVDVGGNCYVYETAGGRGVSWNEANDRCVSQGHHLASFNSEDEWNDVLHVLSRYRDSLTDVRGVLVGLKMGTRFNSRLYRYAYVWSDSTIAYYNKFIIIRRNACSRMELNPISGTFQMTVTSQICEASDGRDRSFSAAFLCETTDKKVEKAPSLKTPVVNHSPNATSYNENRHVVCPSGHRTHSFMACDIKNRCWGEGYGPYYTCDAPVSRLPPMFLCENEMERVPYAVVCDHVSDCGDDSDEQFCTYLPCCDYEFDCGNKQCIAARLKCDGYKNCLTGRDEGNCLATFAPRHLSNIPSGVVHFLADGSLYIAKATVGSAGFSCPESHYMCRSSNFCLPVFTRCNDIHDCPAFEDEAGCRNYTCPGFFRCRSSRVCLHASHLCDGVVHCPHGDDEMLCDLSCPEDCTCYGMAFFCAGPLSAAPHTRYLRFLDARGSRMSVETAGNFTLLISLCLASCRLSSVRGGVLLPNLRELDLSDNSLTSIPRTFPSSFPNLRVLDLRNNLLGTLCVESRGSLYPFQHLHTLDLSGVVMSTVTVCLPERFPSLRRLNLSGTGITQVPDGGVLHKLKDLQMIDIRNCPVTYFSRDVFLGLNQLESVYTDNNKLCCPAILPSGFNVNDCQSPPGLVSSCYYLLRFDFTRAIMPVLAALALMGNAVSLVYRIYRARGVANKPFYVFLLHLNTSDFVMGVYLVTLVIVDRVFEGRYVWEDNGWRHSVGCTLAGVLVVVSNVTSHLLILAFTFLHVALLCCSRNLRLSNVLANLICVFAWSTGFSVAVFPFVAPGLGWRFYGKSALCIPVDTSDGTRAAGYLGFFVTLNLIASSFTAAGQAYVFCYSRKLRSTVEEMTNKRSLDKTLFARVDTTSLTHCVCHFVVAVAHLFASGPMTASRTSLSLVSQAARPAVNPFLYVLAVVMEKRAAKRNERLQRLLKSHLQGTQNTTRSSRVSSGGQDRLVEICRSWLRNGMLSAGHLADMVRDT